MNKRANITLAVVASMIALGIIGGMNGRTSSVPGEGVSLPVVEDVVGLRLDEAKDVLAGISVDEEDYLGEDSVWRDKNWTVCAQSVNPGRQADSILLKVAKDSDDCPDQRTPEERAAENVQEAKEQATLEAYYAELQTRLTPNTAVLKPGEWVTMEQCEVSLLAGPAVNTFDTYDDAEFLATNSLWRIKEMGDYLYIHFETNPGCKGFDSKSVTVEKGYDPYYEKHNSYSLVNSFYEDSGVGRYVTTYKVKDGATKFKLGLNYGAGPFYEFSAR